MRYEELENEAEYLAQEDADLPYDQEMLQDVYAEDELAGEELGEWEDPALAEEHAYV